MPLLRLYSAISGLPLRLSLGDIRANVIKQSLQNPTGLGYNFNVYKDYSRKLIESLSSLFHLPILALVYHFFVINIVEIQMISSTI